MKKLFFLVLVLCITLLFSCKDRNRTKPPQPVAAQNNQPETTDDANTVTIVFSLELNEQIYKDTSWGEPPQFAIWLENTDTQQIKTIFATYRTASGHWAGKVECPVSLPYWVSRYNKETKTTGPPTYFKPAPDAITGPTPKQKFTTSTELPRNSQWNYFIEVNVSGDFNIDFPAMRENGAPDPQGNGQPSIVYSGQIKATDNFSDTPKIIGRTNQWRAVDELITDLKGIDTAKKLFSKIQTHSSLEKGE